MQQIVLNGFETKPDEKVISLSGICSNSKLLNIIRTWETKENEKMVKKKTLLELFESGENVK